MYDEPILLITFNRPLHVRRVLKEILGVSPRDLYVFQDGPRVENADDCINCKLVRDTVETMVSSSETQLHTYYSNVNLGCGPGPAAGISWFFENVEQGIIIEDDAVPNSDFFYYAKELLNRYKENSDVRAIGSMKIDSEQHGTGSYYFSRVNRNLCAWATWRRAWKDFDIHMANVSAKQLNSALKHYGCKLREREFWLDRLKEVHYDGIGGSSWDMQFFMSIWVHGGKGIMPNVNLCSNIGFDSEGTHTTETDNVAANVPTAGILPLVHPNNENIDRRADFLFHKLYFTPYQYGMEGLRRLPYRMNRRLKRLVGHEGPWIKKNK